MSSGGDIPVTLPAGGAFGSATSFSGDGTVLAVGSYDEDKGAVRILEKSDDGWSQSLKIFDKPTADGAAGTGELDISLTYDSYFGAAVAISADGTLLAVGANGTDSGSDSDSGTGAVYLFEKQRGTWSQSLEISENAGGTGKLNLSLGSYAYFGSGVSLSADGTLLAVGAYGDSSHNGSVYLFEKSGGTWSQSLKIFDRQFGAPGAGELDITLPTTARFGSSVALSADGTFLVAGAVGENSRKGAVYLFEKVNDAWSQAVKISDNSGNSGEIDIQTWQSLTAGDQFGVDADFSLNGTLLAVSASGTDSGKGAVYIFKRRTSSGIWEQILRISDNSGGTGNHAISLDSGDRFGQSVSFLRDGGVLAVGAHNDDDGGSDTGAVYLHTVPGSARSVSVTASDDSTGTVWHYVTTTGTACGAAQFTSPTAYTEGNAVSFSAESDTGKRVCFRSANSESNAGYALSAPVTIDRTAPVLTPVRVGAGTTANYRVRVTDSSAATGRTKDAVSPTVCTTAVDTTAAGWTDYTPGDLTGTAHDTDGRCVIITDDAGNIAKQHLLDSDSVSEGLAPRTVTGDTRVTLLWTVPGDSTITGYEYQQKTGAGSYGAWTAVPGSSDTTERHTFTGLINGTTYGYKLRTKRGSVAGTATAEVTATPSADTSAPTLGTVTATSADGTLAAGVRYLNTGDTVTVTVPVIDPNPPTTAPTVTAKFGASGTERTMTAGTGTTVYGLSSVITTYTYTYSLVNDDTGTFRHKVTAVTDSASTPNRMTDRTVFTAVPAITASAPVTNIGLQADSDSGTVGDDITDDHTAPVIAFTQVSGATITARYRKRDGSWTAIPSGSISATATAGTVTLPNLMAGDGAYEVEITQQVSGQQSRAAVYSFTLETAAITVSVSENPFHPRRLPVIFSEKGAVSVSLVGNDSFGMATALSADGTLMAVGAGGVDGFKGAVYLFEVQDELWTQSLKIFDKPAADGGPVRGEFDIPLNARDSFGVSVALSADGTLLAVGARGVDGGKGAVYLFEKNNNRWTQSLKIFDKVGAAGAGELDVSLDRT